MNNLSVTASPHKLPHMKSLDGLRGMAILLVISFHYGNSFGPLAFGWSGVDLFFVLSGFLITSRLRETLGHKGYFRNFFRNRALRILPLYYGMLMLFFFSVWIINQSHPFLIYYRDNMLPFFLFLENFHFIFHGLPDSKELQHFWSLAVEEQFYIVWPLLIFIFRHSRRLLALMGGLIVLTMILRFCLIYQSAFDATRFIAFSSLCRMDSLLSGAAVSILYANGKLPDRKIVFIFLITASILLFTGVVYAGNASPFNIFFLTTGYTITAVFYACILLLLLSGSSLLLSIFSGRLLRFLGRISYGLYVFHWPILLFILAWYSKYRLAGRRDLSASENIFCSLLSLVVSIFISSLSFRYFESYFLNLKQSRTTS